MGRADEKTGSESTHIDRPGWFAKIGRVHYENPIERDQGSEEPKPQGRAIDEGQPRSRAEVAREPAHDMHADTVVSEQDIPHPEHEDAITPDGIVESTGHRS